MKEKIVGILVCILLFASALVVAAPTNKKVIETTPMCSPFTGNIGTPSGSSLKQLSSLLGKTVYACHVYPPPYDKKLVSFTLDDPGTINNITKATSRYFLSGGCWVYGDGWWACEYQYYEKNNSKIWKINTTTGKMTLIGHSGVSLNGLAYDDETSTMYACSDTILYTINMFNGRATKVGTFGITDIIMIGIACDSAGKLYGESLGNPGCLCAINETSGKASLIGSFGFFLNYAQDIAFDKDTDKLYLAACIQVNQTTYECALYSCNHHTAATTKIADFPPDTEIDAFAIPYTYSGLQLGTNGGLGISVVVTNKESANLTNVTWKLQVKGGILGLINKTVNGTVDIKAGESKTFSTGMLLGFGSLSISASVEGVEKIAKGTQLLIFSIVKK